MIRYWYNCFGKYGANACGWCFGSTPEEAARKALDDRYGIKRTMGSATPAEVTIWLQESFGWNGWGAHHTVKLNA